MKLFITSLAFVFILVCTIATIESAPNRIEACESLIPPHEGAEPRNNTKFDLIYRDAGDGTYIVIISGAQTGSSFGGFFVQARDADNPWAYQTFGQFQSLSTKEEPFTCLTQNDMIKHANNVSVQFVQARWIPPSGPVSVVFRGTVVQSVGEISANLITEQLVITN